MTSKLIKISKFVFYVLLVGIIFSSALPMPKASALADTVVLSRQRTILHNFVGCVSRYGARDDDGVVFDTHRKHFKQWDDAIADDMDDQEWVVGLDVDSNGVLACVDIVPLGINTLIDRGVSIPNSNGKFTITTGGKNDDKQQKTEITFWFAKYVTGFNLGSSSGDVVNTLDYKTEDFEKKLRDLADLAKKEIDKIGEPTDLMNQRRYIGLFNLCYNSSSTKIGEPKTSDGDFVKDGKYYYRLSNDDIAKTLTANAGGIWNWYKTDNTGIGTGDTQHLKIDDLVIAEVQTGGVIVVTMLGRLLDDETIHAYYPIGSDIPPSKTSAARREGMTKCDKLGDASIMNAVFAGSTVIDSKNKLDFGTDNPNSKDALNTTPSTVGGVAENTTDVEPTCETSGFSLGWVTCGIINGLNGIVQGVFTGFIEPYLVTSPINTEANAENPIFKVWSAMRSIANIVLIFGLLFVVFGQAIGGGMIDAYTAKKIVPRILIAAILINISIYLVAALIDIFNIVGAGIGNLFLAPFKDTIFTKFNGGSSGGNTLIVGTILAAAVVTILSVMSVKAFTNVGVSSGRAALFTVAPFLHFILVFILIPAVLITLAIFATLIIRQGIILVLIVTAPIAFALFALPATEKYFTKWRETFVSTLMVYPIITVLFAVSIVMASISYNVGDSSAAPLSSVIGAIVSFIILFVPLALIPFAFKIAGGLIGNILNTSRSLTSKLTASPQNKYKENKALERKSLYEQKAADPSSFTNRRISAKGQGRKVSAEKRKAWIGGVRNSRGPDDEVAAYEGARSTAKANGVDVGGQIRAGEAARATYRTHKRTLTDASGNIPPTDQAAAAVGGAVAGAATARGGHTQQLVASASSAAVNTYRTSVAQGFTHEESVAAANASADALLAGRSQQAANIAGRTAANSYRQQLGQPGSNSALASSGASSSAQAAANVYDEALRRNGGNATQAEQTATDGGNAALLTFEQNRGTHSLEAASTAALAAGDAFMGTNQTGPARASAIQDAARAAADAHDNAVMTGTATDHEQASTVGRQAGQAHW